MIRHGWQCCNPGGKALPSRGVALTFSRG